MRKYINTIISSILVLVIGILFARPAVISANTPVISPVLLNNAIPAFESEPTLNFAGNNVTEGTVPSWVAFDISTLTPGQKSALLFHWYSDNLRGSWPYDWNVYKTDARGLPKDYAIQVNSSAGGTGQPPASGWTNLESITNNPYHSRQHLVNAGNANWIRMQVSSIIDTFGGNKAKFSLILSDASTGLQDNWLFLGDSITQSCMAHGGDLDPNHLDFTELVNAKHNLNLPIYEAGGVAGKLTDFGVANMDKWLAMFPGKYVALSYGTNDAIYGPRYNVSPNSYGSNMGGMVYKVLMAGKVPIIPRIPWGKPNHERAALLNQQIDKIYSDFPQVLKGPDFYTFFKENPHLINEAEDEVHPNIGGCTEMRKMWTDFAINTVYKSQPASTKTGNVLHTSEAINSQDLEQVVTDFGKKGMNLRSDVEKSDSSANKVDIFDYNLVMMNLEQ